MTQIFTATEKHRAMIRELEFRRYVYPKRVTSGQMSRREADWEIQIFEAIAFDYAKAAEQERLSVPLDAIGKAITRNEDGTPMTIIGAVVDELNKGGNDGD